ncbi:MAG: hypothetical protein A2620_00530 [Acidobacteria bacterium RIFCSPHIGHO2_01_FULL_67_28]|nr:MAG: hypothetical protein A2620_00530 [Acidobacteria bacterium RIFCSPHIGHO2_01_FULL_67_28]
MKPWHAIFGLTLVAAGFLFDFGFVTTTSNFRALQENPAAYLSSWSKYAYELTRLYLFVLGFLNLAFALLVPCVKASARRQAVVSGLLVGGSVLFLIGGFWEARSGPAFEWEPACYVLTAGLAAILLSLGAQVYLLAQLRGAMGGRGSIG